MEVKQITEEEFKNILKEKGMVLIDCFATWCGPCRMMAPIVDAFAKENESYQCYKLDIDEAEEVAMDYGINSIPTLLLFKDGELVGRSVGFISKEELETFVKKY